MNLSEQQKKAVEHMGTPTLVVAGAGSGKTRTLTAKIAYLVENGLEPERILAITFTNKAAEEMKLRLVRQTGLDISRFPWVRTFHSACYKVLRIHCTRLGYHNPLQIYDTYKQQKLLRDILVGKLNFDKKHVLPVLSQISNAKNSGNPSSYFDRRSKHHHIPLWEVFENYEKELKNANAVDFDNILMMTRNLLRDHEDIREKYRSYFEYVLCDEYQDTNNLQEELTGLLVREGRLFCVGDDWQAIYSFRGSNVDHFLSFRKKYDKAKIFRLEQNYRSSNEIVRVANDLIEKNPDRMKKKCFSQKNGGRIEVNGFFSDEQEADWVAQKARSLNSLGMPYGKMAVLYRTKFCSLPFEQAFRAHRIPFRILGGKGFFERKEILDLNCYVTAAVFPRDDVSFERIINIPKRGVGTATIKKFYQNRQGGAGLQETVRKAIKEKLLAPKLYNALDYLICILDEIKTLKPDEAIKAVIERTHYMEYLKEYVRSGSMEFTSREENIEQLLYSASKYDTLLDYLEEAALVKEDTEDAEDKNKGVNLMTIHASKGLEYSTVFVVACEEQIFPHWKSVDSDFGLQEERRLMYVAITRSEKFLYLSSANYRKGQVNQRSRFLDELSEVITSGENNGF
jgi:DNA helicase II / ATP-dependent DNA helicase PcrA